VKEPLILYNLRIDHVMIRSQLIYLNGAKVAGTVIWNRGPGTTRPKNRGFTSGPGNNPAKTKPFGFWPGLEPNRTEPPAKNPTTGGLPGPVANTKYDVAHYTIVIKTSMLDNIRKLLRNSIIHCCENTLPSLNSPAEVDTGLSCSQSLLQTGTEVSPTPKFNYPISQIV